MRRRSPFSVASCSRRRSLAVVATACIAVTLVAPATAGEGWPVETPGTFLVMNKRDNTVTLIGLDTGERLATLPTGTEPHEGTASHDGRYAVISNTDYNSRSGHTLTVIDVIDQKVTKTVPLDGYANPHGIDFLPDGRRVIVTTEGREAIVIVDVEKGKVTQAIDTGGHPCHMVVAAPDGTRAYATSIERGTLVVLDLEAGKMVAAVTSGDGAEGFDVSPDGREVWVGNRRADTVSIIDTGSLEVVEKVASKGFPIRLKFALGGKVALVSNYRANAVSVIDVATRDEVARIAMGEGDAPIGILVAPDGRYAFIANTGSNRVTVIDALEYRAVFTLGAGNTPDGMAWTTASP